MKKIKTNIGYMYLPNESTVKTATVPFNETNHNKTIDMITITSDGTKKLYHTENPYGIGYTDHYDRVLASKKAVQKLTAGKPARKIDFLEIS